jgi:hypothetical protein
MANHWTIENIKQEIIWPLREIYIEAVPEKIFFNKLREVVGVRAQQVREMARAIHELGYMEPTNRGSWRFIGEFVNVGPAPEVKTAAENEKFTEYPEVKA